MMPSKFTPITVTKNMFYQGSDRWSPKGVCFQPTDGVDPLTDRDLLATLLEPSTAYGLTKLNINCLRVYQVDTTPSQDRDKVMEMLADAGIAVLVGAVNATTAIARNATSLSKTTVDRVKAVADIYAQYPNVLGFSLSNELLSSNSPSEYGLPSLVKELKQHLASHMTSKGYRSIPIGCCTRDDPSFTFPATDAYVCGSAHERMDFIGYNCYRWDVPSGSSPSAGTIGQYYLLYDHFKDYPVPVMLTEIGAQCIGGRDWTQIPYIFGSKQVAPSSQGGKSADMASAISGCFAFRYYEQGPKFGLVEPAGSKDPSPMERPRQERWGGGYLELAARYEKITSFSGSPNSGAEIVCSSLKDNHYAGNSESGGLAEPTEVTLTNDISNPARNIAFSYSLKANPTADDWHVAVSIPEGGSSQSFTFPAGTQAISMAYQVTASQWLQGCLLTGANLLALKQGDTIQGQWVAPDGNGSCQVVS